jgi:hypothetical protein
MKSGWERSTAGALALVASSCAPLTDEVFAPSGLASSAPVVFDERAGVVEIALRLAQPREQSFSLAYRLVGVDAQDDCQQPDFGAADGRVEWGAGALEAQVRVWIADDDVAERDERFEVQLETDDSTGTTLVGHVPVVIADDDRSALLDAREFGVLPGADSDQSAALQTALDRAAELGRGVLVMAPGDYEISSVSLSAGTTLSAYGARWHRPALSAPDIVSLRQGHEGAEPSQRTLVEGLTIDGRREEQGPYRDHERQNAHLVALEGDSEQGGALRTSFERLALVSGTGSGLFIGPDSEVTVCRLDASELWRDALTLNGGGTVLRVRDLDATATQGTGLWLAAHAPGFGNSYRIDVEAEDLSVGAGDIEIEVSDSSQVILRRLTMTEPPFRLDARGGIVRITDSVLALGPASERSSWAVVHDVEITRTTLAASAEATNAAKPADFSAISVTSQTFSPGPPSSGSGHLTFSDCRFELAGDVTAGTAVYAIENADTDAAIGVASSQLGAGFTDWFAPQCRGCVRTR